MTAVDRAELEVEIRLRGVCTAGDGIARTETANSGRPISQAGDGHDKLFVHVHLGTSLA